MPKLAFARDELLIQLSPFESILALHAPLRIKLTDIRQARRDDSIRQSGFGLRAPGTGIPYLLSAGTYHRNGEKQFVFVTRNTGILVVELQSNPFTRIILGLPNADEAATSINRAIAPA